MGGLSFGLDLPAICTRLFHSQSSLLCKRMPPGCLKWPLTQHRAGFHWGCCAKGGHWEPHRWGMCNTYCHNRGRMNGRPPKRSSAHARVIFFRRPVRQKAGFTHGQSFCGIPCVGRPPFVTKTLADATADQERTGPGYPFTGDFFFPAFLGHIPYSLRLLHTV